MRRWKSERRVAQQRRSLLRNLLAEHVSLGDEDFFHGAARRNLQPR